MKFLNEQIDIPVTTGNTTSAAIDASQLIKLSVQATSGAGSAMTGSLQMQVSNDPVNVGYFMSPAPTAWSNLGSALAIAAPATSYLIAQQDVCYRSIRFVFTGNIANDASVAIKIMALAI